MNTMQDDIREDKMRWCTVGGRYKKVRRILLSRMNNAMPVNEIAIYVKKTR